MAVQDYDFGMIGLGTMGRNLVYNMSDKGYKIAGFDKNNTQLEQLKKGTANRNIFSTSKLDEFIAAIKNPKVILLLVPAGKIVDDVIKELTPLLSEGDLIIDCGNSHFSDTTMRSEELEKSKIHFMGVGISGGEEGARNGPSIMPGGSKQAYRKVATMFESIAAKVNGEPCVAWLGPGSAGHYVKMVHNGIEYGLMQLISESYHLLKVAGGMSNDELHDVFANWNMGKLQSYLIEITSNIFTQKDDFTSHPLIDMILDRSEQNGTGAWTSLDALTLQVPLTNIDVSVAMRDLSSNGNERELAHQKLYDPATTNNLDKLELVYWLQDAIYFSMIVTFSQGFSLLQAASKKYGFGFNLGEIVRIWRGGCIIRADLLEDILKAVEKEPHLPDIMISDTLAQKLKQSETGIRNIIKIAINASIPVPVFMSSLSYFDSIRSGWLPANLIQAQRDYFGAHTYKRTDRQGTFHTLWLQNQK